MRVAPIGRVRPARTEPIDDDWDTVAASVVPGEPLDVKPSMAEFGLRGEVAPPGWSHEPMRGYWSST